jgi:hypothetical protein
MTHTTNENDTWMIWPCGTMAMQDEIDVGDYAFMSDDYCLATDKEVADYMEKLDDLIEDHARYHNLRNTDKIILGPRVPYFKTVH